MPHTNTTDHEYDPGDVDSLDQEARQVMLAIARQTGVIDDPDATDTPNEPETPTTRTIRKATGLNRDKINYRFRVLEGKIENGCDPALINTELPGVNDDGTMPPKQVTLTRAGKQAIGDDVISTDPAPDMPDWVTTADITGQVKQIAEQIDDIHTDVRTTQNTLNLIAQIFGFNGIDELADKAERGDVTRDDAFGDDVVAGEFRVTDEPIVETLAKMYQGMQATERSVRQLGADPMDDFVPPGEVEAENTGD